MQELYPVTSNKRFFTIMENIVAVYIQQCTREPIRRNSLINAYADKKLNKNQVEFFDKYQEETILKDEYSSANCLMTKFRKQKRLNQISKVKRMFSKMEFKKNGEVLVKYKVNKILQ
ncbi:hypothetical protein RhiirA5_427248 [Rhizophagus irregularis]|uniref:Uncharacterized protein n=1 Tax=Rhizophagus irregularis TaxID=588596 RepID=A0A2N0P2Q6_9GLOM|nr:hypothetical protein RhiirA5_427248 [Rhizophagus irregularis]